MLIFDCETNGLLHELDRLHCLVIEDTVTGERTVYNNQDGDLPGITEGVRRLQEATEAGVEIVGHNAIKFDVPAIQKVYSWFKPVSYYVWDTMILGRLIYPDLTEVDGRLKAKGQLPPRLYKKHTLESWGYRLGLHKGDYRGGWDEWNQEMQDYCVQDVVVTSALLARLLKSKLAPDRTAIDLEMAVAFVVARQERHGFCFDVEKAGELYRKLAKRRAELDAILSKAFRPWYTSVAVRIPSKSSRHQIEELGFDPKAPIYEKLPKGATKAMRAARKVIGYKYRTADLTEGAAYTPVKLTTFKPSSRDHVANRLTKLYGWEPTEFTDDGKPKVDETVLKGLPYPEAPTLEEFFTVLKRIGQLAEGKEAWLKHVGKDGRIHGGVNTNGAVTGRMTHMYPNVGQVPAVRSPYGTECRACFGVPPDKEQVGADADALELRCLAHFMAAFDGGEYVRAVNEGKKSDGTDAHSVNARAIGLDPKALLFGEESGRDIAKTWFYAMIYGAGLPKLGITITRKKKGAGAVGKRTKEALMANLPAFDKLVKAVKAKAKKNGGYIRGLDGRWVRIRSEHSALNTLLQSAGAVLMKRALVILDTNLQEKGYVPGTHYEFIANVHDEWQLEVQKGLGAEIGRLAVDAIRLAGESFGFRCPLTGEFRVGRNWAECH